MSKFKVGEIVLAIEASLAHGDVYVGEECEIMEIGEFIGRTNRDVFEYRVKMRDGSELAANENELRKLPPKDTPTAWDESIFMPEDLKVS